ncbi:hypothetical protein BDV96DRAFT_490560 [Lophiotrema nucula]|uniref:DUF6594 domain-containing protein n=1 Tax=Lophiotrema nucula TaxID=690887 RepID=A0A6A5ZCK6_9PLEO|nr:hypothetical protein BDV96DRAFT_490560 [Lophiotrema nucula]
MPSSLALPDTEIATHPRDGFPDFAAWIAHDPDNESYVFRKFDTLAARNLLNLQSELMVLEEKIQRIDEEMRSRHDVEAKVSLRRWETFQIHAQDPNRPEYTKLKLETELEEKIKKYHEALLLQSQIASLKEPSRRVFNTFRSFFYGSFLDTPKPIVLGRAEQMLKDQKDLVALRPPLDIDLLSRTLRNHWPFPGQSYAGHTEYFHESTVNLVVAIINILVAAVLLIAPITSLYFISRHGVKLGMIAGFTTLFAVSVGLLTSAKKQEIFAASAAYAAVLVVFVSGNLKND